MLLGAASLGFLPIERLRNNAGESSPVVIAYPELLALPFGEHPSVRQIDEGLMPQLSYHVRQSRRCIHVHFLCLV